MVSTSASCELPRGQGRFCCPGGAVLVNPEGKAGSLQDTASLPPEWSLAGIQRSKTLSSSSCCLRGSPAKCLWFQSGVGDGGVCSGVQILGEGRGFNTEKIVFRERRLPAGALEVSNPACSLAMSENHRLTGASS